MEKNGWILQDEKCYACGQAFNLPQDIEPAIDGSVHCDCQCGSRYTLANPTPELASKVRRRIEDRLRKDPYFVWSIAYALNEQNLSSVKLELSE